LPALTAPRPHRPVRRATSLAAAAGLHHDLQFRSRWSVRCFWFTDTRGESRRSWRGRPMPTRWSHERAVRTA